MAVLDYNRYDIIGDVEPMPFIQLPVNTSDKYELWNDGFSRYDKYAKKYYGNPFYDFLIMYANPQYISEFDIKSETLIRIPFPLNKAKADYEAILSAYKKNNI
jgi:hypothetical protein